MSNDWDFYSLRVDDQPASIFVDLGIRSQAPIRTHSVMAYLRIFMTNPRADGLSSQEEFERLIAIEDSITVNMTRDQIDLFVGRNTSSGNRDFYFYSSDPMNFDARVRRIMSEHPLYEYETGQRDDPDWGVYFDFLYPSEMTMQIILNRRVCQQLEKNGDDLTLKRKIDHLALFQSPEAQEAFAKHVAGNGFVIGNITSIPNSEGHFLIEFSRNDVPAQIDDVVLPLYEAASAGGGIYDGWGCEPQP